MAHLLPPAGVQEPKGDLFRFYQVVENTACDLRYDDIPVNIHDYRWTDYLEEDRICRAQNEEFKRQEQQSDLLRHKTALNSARSRMADAGSVFNGHGLWGYCPPIGVDPRSLIRPLSKSLDSSTRPTGAPYFAQESKPSCLPHEAPLAKKGGFNFQQWLATYNKRLPPDDLKGHCLPSLCTWCQPIYVDCCPDYKNPWAYSIAKNIAPFYTNSSG